MKITLFLVILVFGIPQSLVEGTDSCEDESFSSITVGSSTDIQDCRALVKAWPYYCNPNAKDTVSEKCCKSCLGVDYSCQDQSIVLTSKNADGSLLLMSCAELAASEYVVHCRDTTSPIGEVCCRSCSRAGLRCVDDPSVLFSWGVCKDIIDDTYGCSKCNDDTIRGYCCASCRKYTRKYCMASCVDDPSWYYELPEDKTITCNDLKEKYACLCSQYKSKCCDSCKNVDPRKCMDCPIFAQPLKGEVYHDCSVVELYPSLCDHEFFYKNKREGHCCATCADSRGADHCVDSPLATFTVNDDVYNCAKLFELSHCVCDKDQVKSRCCATCKGVDTLRCGCKDLLSRDYTVAVMGRNVGSCRILLHEVYGYPYYCTLDKFGGAGGLCCDSCRNVNTECVDEPIQKVPYPGAVALPCKHLAVKWPYFCKQTSSESKEDGYKDICCHSCKYADTSCTNVPHNIDVMGMSLTCIDIARKYPYFCRPDQYQEECCRSCRNVDHTCTDNPYWINTITYGKKGDVCQDCTCQDIRQKMPLRKAACCEGGAAQECCRVCRNIQCQGR